MSNNQAPKRGSMKEAVKTQKEKQDAKRDKKHEKANKGILNHKDNEIVDKRG